MTEIGATAQSIVNFRSHLGQPMGWFRKYVTGTSEPAWSSTTFDNVRAGDALGEKTCVSFKTAGNWSQIAAGARDAFLTQLANGLATLTHPGIIVGHHEPENDTATYGTSAQFRAALQHEIAVMRPLAPGWKFYNCYMDYTFNTLSGRNPDDWFVPELDGLGFDMYNWVPTNADPPWANSDPSAISPEVVFHNVYGHQPAFPKDDIRHYAASKGLPYALMEFACAIESPGGTTEEARRTAWYKSFADYVQTHPDPNFIAVMAFNFNAGESGATHNFAIDRDSGVGFAPATIAQFARIDDALAGPGWGSGPWGSMPWGGGSGAGTKSVTAAHLNVPITLRQPALRYKIVAAHLVTPVTVYAPAVSPPPGTQHVTAVNLAVPVTMRQARVVHASNIVQAALLVVPVTMRQPSVIGKIVATHLVAAVTLNPPSLTQTSLPNPTAHVQDRAIDTAHVSSAAIHTAHVDDRRVL